MKIEQIYTGCLAQGAYFIVSDGEAAIIDPLREVNPYLDRLKSENAKLKYIFETHFHADFVSGHLDLHNKTGATIVFGPGAVAGFECISAEDGTVFEIGKIKIKLLHTPGHTMESSTFLLIDEEGKDHAIFSGDTLFIGDVGRPDLAQKAAQKTKEELASLLFFSLRNKIMTLGDDVIVYPAHGAGSACGKNLSKETVSTIGHEKKFNYALRADMTEAEFIEEVTAGLLPAPGYFGMNVAMNKEGYENFDLILNRGMRALKVHEFEAAAESGALILDTRNGTDFSKGFIPQSINIGLNGDFAPWVGALLMDIKTPILLITYPGREEEAITRLSRVGFDHIIGYLVGGFETWKDSGKTVDHIETISTNDFSEKVNLTQDKIIDIRKESEYAAQHVEESYNKPLAYINEWIRDIDPQEHFYIHCAGGYRSMIASSILQSRGYRNFTEVNGGFEAMSKLGIPTTNYICTSKMMKV